MPVYADPAGGLRVNPGALFRWTAEIVQRLGSPADSAADVAEMLVAYDRRGIASHGTARLPQYVKLADARVMDPAARPVLERGKTALSLFDAQNGFGPHAGRVGLDHAIDRARDNGTAIAVVRNSNHYGIAGWYAM